MLSALPQEITITKRVEHIKVSTYVACRVLLIRGSDGPFSVPIWKPPGRKLKRGSNCVVRREDGGPLVITAVRRQMHNDGSKSREPKRQMLLNRRDAYQEFKQQHPGLVKMSRKVCFFVPANCRWPGQAGTHRSCVGQIHENFKLTLNGLKNTSIENIRENAETCNENIDLECIFDDINELVKFLLCSPSTENCFL